MKAAVRCQYASNRTGAVLYPRGYVSALEERIAWLEQNISHDFPQLNITEVPTNSRLHFASQEVSTQEDSQRQQQELPSPGLREEYRVGPAHYYYEAFRNPTETMDDLAAHVGFLSLGAAAEQSSTAISDAPAEPRFIGSSSSLAVASSVNLLLREFGLQRPLALTAAEMRGSYLKSSDVPKSESTQNQVQIKAEDGTTAAQDILESDFWPSYEECMTLATAGLEEVVFYPVLNTSTFMIYLRNSYQPVVLDTLRTLPPWRLFLFSICAIGAAALGQRDKQRAFFAQAMRNLDATLSLDHVRSLRALMLISIYSFYDPEAASAWLCVGTAIRIAIALGLHRQSSQHNLNLINQEIRKRVFWVLYSLDRVLSSILGRPLMLRDCDIDVALFLDLGQDPELTGNNGEPIFADISIALHMVKLRQITGKILVTINKPANSASAEDSTTVEQLHRALDDWKAKMPRITIAPERTRMRIELEHHEQLMLLYRPSPAYPIPTASAISVCANSATAIIDLYSHMIHSFESRPPTFLTLRGIFVAAMTLLWSYIVGYKYRIQILTAQAVMSSSSTAKALLQEGASQWAIGAQCAEVLGHILTVLESVEMQQQQQGASTQPTSVVIGGVEQMIQDLPFDVSSFSGVFSGNQAQPQFIYEPSAVPYSIPEHAQNNKLYGFAGNVGPEDLDEQEVKIMMYAARREFESYDARLINEVFAPQQGGLDEIVASPSQQQQQEQAYGMPIPMTEYQQPAMNSSANMSQDPQSLQRMYKFNSYMDLV